MLKVSVSPDFSVPYYAFYLEGLCRVFGPTSITFDEDTFPSSSGDKEGLAFTIQGRAAGRALNRRIYISANDWARYDAAALEWCDRYGMVNHDPKAAPAAGGSKIVPIGPSFGVRQWQSLAVTARAVAHLLPKWLTANRSTAPKRLNQLRKHFFNRRPETDYRPAPSDDSYVFFVAWPWKKHPHVNPPRARFMRVCKRSSLVRFEGGFAPRRRADVPMIADVTAERLYSFTEWLGKTQRSAAVFNCPAVHDCHGWKLGEFLALGKAIITLPLSRSLPVPLEHGHTCHFVDDDDDHMLEALERLIKDRPYRTALEVAARQYYLEHLAPERVILRLVYGSFQ